MNTIIGWDIGGAHVKAALINENAQILKVAQHACPLWQGLAHLRQALSAILLEFGQPPARHAVTMTGELVDLFENRNDGVKQILAELALLIKPESITVFAGQFGFLSLTSLTEEHFPAIASANWLATARYIAQQQAQGLLVDIGSTTTDILCFRNGSVAALGYSDYERLISGELIYTGIIRTAVMAVAQQAFFKGRQQGLMAEYFATMADVYRLTGELNEHHDQSPTADGGAKSVLASALRLSRMTGYEFVESDLALWQQFAHQLRHQQLELLSRGCEQQLSRGLLTREACFIGAGVGRFLVKSLAAHLGYAYVDFDRYFADSPLESRLQAADCAPAVAVACLLIAEHQ